MDTESINKNIRDHHDLWENIFLGLMRRLIGIIPRSMRGITLNFDGETIQICVIFDRQPSEIEIDDLQNIEAELVSGHDYMSDLVINVVSPGQDVSDLVKNFGWVYLRKSD